MHFEEGTAEYNALVKHLESDNALLDSALASVSGKAYGFDLNKMRDIGKRIAENPNIYHEFDREHTAQYARKRRDPLINNVFPMYEPFTKSGSEANRLAIDWVHRKDTKTGYQALISYHDRWYLIQKLDDSDLGYIILRRVLKAELQDITKEIEKRGKIAKVKSILSTVDGYGSNDKIQLSLKGRGRSSNSVDANHGREGAEVVRLDKSETDWGERDRRNGSGDSSSGGSDKSRFDLEVSQEELAEFTDFMSEVSAHMGELLLGSEAFIDAIVAKDGNIAQKTVAKIKSLKAMFERLGNAEASAEYKFLKKAEDLYLKAAEKAGDAQLIRYIVSGEWDEEEAQYARKTTNAKNLPKIKKYIKISSEQYNILYKKVSALYSGMSNGFADGIAIEDGDTIYIIDSGKDNGKLDFGVREKLIRSNSLSRLEYIRRTNDEAIRRGFVDDGLSGRIRDRLYNDRASDRRQDEGLQLPITQRESRHNESGVSSKNEEATKGIKYSFKENSANNKNTVANNENEASDNKKPTSYTKAEEAQYAKKRVNAKAIRNLYDEVYNENNREEQRDGESVCQDYERYWSLSNDRGDDNFDVEEQNANGCSREVYGGQSKDYRRGDTDESARDKRNIKFDLNQNEVLFQGKGLMLKR